MGRKKKEEIPEIASEPELTFDQRTSDTPPWAQPDAMQGIDETVEETEE